MSSSFFASGYTVNIPLTALDPQVNTSKQQHEF